MKINHASIKARDIAVMSGIDKHITTTITINGAPYTPAELKAVFQSQVTALDANDTLHKSLADGVANAKAIGTKVNAMYHLLRGALIGQYGKNSNAVLNDFGMTAPKVPGPKTVEVKATAAAKRAATRTARQTMGTVQKKAVVGNVVGITVTPVVAGAPVAATAAATSTVKPTQPVVSSTQPVVAPTPTVPAAGAGSAVVTGGSTPSHS